MKNLFISWICLVISTSIFGQNHKFEKVDAKSTILNSVVYDLLQDRNGFIWIGGSDGLGKYDGHNVIDIRHFKNVENSICNNQINCIAEAADGKIWIGTKGGLSVFDPKTESSRCLYNFGEDVSRGDNIVLSVVADRNGYIWYSTYNGLFRFDPANEERQAFLPDENDEFSIANKLVFSIFEDKEGTLWFATRNGISMCKNDGLFQFKNVLYDPSTPGGLQHERFFTFCQTENGDLWLGGDTGLYKVNESNGELSFINYSHDPQNTNSLSYNFVNHILAEGNNLWVSTWAGGLDHVIFSEGEDPTFVHYRSEKDNPYSLSTDEINKTLIDKSGVLWVGTGFGVMKSSPSTHKFGLVQSKPGVAHSINNNKVQATLVDSEGNLWVGTDRGLNFCPNKNNKIDFNFTTFAHDPDNDKSLSHNNVFDLFEDSSHRIWICTYDGISIANLETFGNDNSFQNIHFKKYPHKWVYNILEVEKDVFWVSTYGKLARMFFPKGAKEPTLDIFDMDTTNPNALANATTYQTCLDGKGRIWVATYYGLSMIDESENCTLFTNFYKVQGDTSSISDVTINCLFLDANKNFWIGTRNGLNLLVEDQNGNISFKTFDESHGLPGSCINFIEEDENGFLWVGTSDGLVQLNPKKARQETSPVMTIYTLRDGLGKGNTGVRSSSKGSDGNIYFGSEGLNYFNPSEMVFNSNVPDLIFTKLKVLNKEVSPENKKILKTTISDPETEINLQHYDNMVEIFFSCMDFSNPEKNRYKYKMEGVNEDWVDSGSKNYATYTNLKSGSYSFHVIGCNNDGVWNNTPISLKIKVNPHWSRSNLAYILYAILALIIAGMIYRWRRNRAAEKIKIIKDIEIARLEEREQLRKQNAADFHDELGHRLTKIALFLEIAKKHVGQNENLKKYLEKVKVNTKSLSEGLKDLIWSLDPKKDTVLDTVNRIQEMGDNIFDYSEMKFSTNAVDNDFKVLKLSPIERKHILLIFKEAMNNTLKYSSADECVFTSEIKNGKAVLTFKDNGAGFDTNEMNQGNGLKNMKERAENIGGELNLVSSPKNGTVISISIPVNDKDFLIKNI